MARSPTPSRSQPPRRLNAARRTRRVNLAPYDLSRHELATRAEATRQAHEATRQAHDFALASALSFLEGIEVPETSTHIFAAAILSDSFRALEQAATDASLSEATLIDLYERWELLHPHAAEEGMLTLFANLSLPPPPPAPPYNAPPPPHRNAPHRNAIAGPSHQRATPPPPGPSRQLAGVSHAIAINDELESSTGDEVDELESSGTGDDANDGDNADDNADNADDNADNADDNADNAADNANDNPIPTTASSSSSTSSTSSVSASVSSTTPNETL
ncbi:hypothetical protein GGX14DRAFT_561560 [Mycena pura]|uniref:Uncharacterized protein n=1 Tax=Mycena pura TaxID=153505 RepID=A0AAD6YEI3_9AGAR|nr:hypothetical protein GGX14DRAFT_561560 [Mycena pura]